MQFVTDGPDIPNDLLHSHEEGRVVFFCGAGVSFPAKLPGFGKLVKDIYAVLGSSPTAEENKAHDEQRYDAAIGLLENRYPGGRFQVRQALAAALKPNTRARGAIATHHALLTLARQHTGAGDKVVRLVTTNFDRLFEYVMRKNPGTRTRTYLAPLLPIPKDIKWNGLVYLHGLLPQRMNEGDLNQLVVSSGDFGIAYLTERWASRFVSELFRNYIVCFVGYSIGDPVLRYMMDALAADRMLGESTLPAYAFAPFFPGEDKAIRNEWHSKQVIPILYQTPNATDHSLLHRTLEEWANTHRDGADGKEQIVLRHALARPSGSTSQDDYVGRLLWALSDASGLPAKRFAEMDPLPSLEWLTAMTGPRFGHADLIRFGVAPNPKIDTKLKFSLLQRPSPYQLSPWMSMYGSSGLSANWDNVMEHIGDWLVRHLDDPSLLLWFAERGGSMHPAFAFRLRRALKESQSTSPHMKTLWGLVLAGRVRRRSANNRGAYAWLQEFAETGSMTACLRAELYDLLRPLVKLGKPFRLQEQDNTDPSTGRLKDLADWDIVLAADDAHIAFREKADRPIWNAALAELVSDFSDLLRQALDLMQQLDGAGETSDFSFIHQPSIAEHPQNQYFEEWTTLVALAREAWVRCAEGDPRRARLEAERWQDYQYPLFRRLTLFAANFGQVIDAPSAVDWLLARDGWWLWSVETQVEVSQLLGNLRQRVSDAGAALIEGHLLRGPPREMFKASVADDEWAKIVNRMTFLRLVAWTSKAPSLSPRLRDRIAQIQAQNPTWSTAIEEEQLFPVYMRGGFGDWRGTATAPTTVGDLMEWIRQNPNADDFCRDNFPDICKGNHELAATSLLNLAAQGTWPVERWREAFQAWQDDAIRIATWNLVRAKLAEADDEFILGVSHSLIWWLRSMSEGDIPDQALWLLLLRRIVDTYRNEEPTDTHDPVGRAINHPVGQATQAVLQLWYQSELKDAQLLPEWLKEFLTNICDLAVKSFRHGRIIVAQAVITLYRVDIEWTRQNVLPLFDWALPHGEAGPAWEGFLWTPRIYFPFLDSVKEPFLSTAYHYREIGDHAEQYATFLTYVALEQHSAYATPEISAATSALPTKGLTATAHALVRALESAGEQRIEFWRNRIRPYLQNVWPKFIDRRTMEISAAFAELCIAAGECLPEALTVLSGWLQPLNRPDMSVRSLDESGLCERLPIDALTLLNAIVGGEPEWAPERLGSCLTKIHAGAPSVIADPRFISMQNYARQWGIL